MIMLLFVGGVLDSTGIVELKLQTEYQRLVKRWNKINADNSELALAA